jgi:membrane-associated phospholipid phosphatase
MRGVVRESGGVNVPPDGTRPVTRRRALLGIAAGCAVLLLLGAGVVTAFGPQIRLDRAVSHAFYAGEQRARWLEVLLQVITAPGLTVTRVLVYLPVLVWLAVRHAWWTLVWVAAAVLTIGPLTSLLKEAFGRVRPAFQNGGARYTSLSFPSGHSSGIATLVTVALVLAWPLLTHVARRRCLAVGIALVVLVGLSRMWLGVHFLTDVLGGWSLGVAWSLALAVAFGGLPGGRAALPARAAVRTAEPS